MVVIGTFIDWGSPHPRPPTTFQTSPQASSNLGSKSPAPTWEDYAFKKRWEDAIIALLRSREGETTGLWTAVNLVVAESIPVIRGQRRQVGLEVLAVMMRLIRERRVLRYRRDWVAILDIATPLDHL